ncbi:Transcriptional regulator, LuxR family [Thermosulfurimonas dismutans]|uniref:Transcriptional regulator, LuxR family n=2 Tax=Thermosulfurimonas dismutans TaxID=999894 RepID=A0A179D145_9BACT|nr:Transcriptional regulator, LuxR family [Thermosulfurimonas dismutans]
MASALGLVLGNVFMGATLQINPPYSVLFPLIGFLLLSQIPARYHPQRKEPLGDLVKYLPIIFLFYLLTGMFYVCLMPTYMKNLYFRGVELIFYIVAVLISAFLFHRKKDYPLVVAVGMGTFAVAFLHDFNRLTSNLAMYAVQTTAGFMDVFCLGLFIRGGDVVRRFSLGASCMCLGLVVGLPVLYTEKWPFIMSIGENIVLGIGLLAFYFLQTAGRRFHKKSPHVHEDFREKKLIEACRALGAPRELFSHRDGKS